MKRIVVSDNLVVTNQGVEAREITDAHRKVVRLAAEMGSYSGYGVGIIARGGEPERITLFLKGVRVMDMTETAGNTWRLQWYMDLSEEELNSVYRTLRSEQDR